MSKMVMSKMVMSHMERSLGEDLREVSINFAEDLIDALEGAGMLSCSASAAKQELGISVEEARVAKPSMLIPFCGEIVEGWCKAVRLNHGLHTQCTNGVDDEEYCSTCSKHAEHSATSKPPYGDIRDRAKFGVDYRDPSGRQTTPYANVAAKMKLDVAKAKVEAAKFGWSIPEEQLVLKERKRGRPKSTKCAAVSDTSSEGNKVSSPQDDLIAKLVMEAADDAASTVSSGSSLSSSQILLKKVRAKTVVVSQKTLSDVAVEAKAAKEAAKAAKEAAKAERARVAAEAKAARDAAKAVRDAAKAAKDAERAEKARVAAEAKAAKDAERAEKARVAAEAKAERDAAKAAKVAEQEAAKAAKEAAKAAKEAAKVEKVRLLEEAKAAKIAEQEEAKAAKLAEKEAAKAEKVRLLEEAKAAKLAEKEAAKAARLAEREAEKEAKKVAVLVEKIKGVRATREALSELPQSQDFPEGSEALKEVLANERKELKKLERAEKPVSGEELQEEASAADAGSDGVTVESEEEDEEEEDEITLTSDMKYEHNGVTYFKTTAYGFENMLFSLGGEAVGILDVESGTLQEVSFAEEDDDLDMD